jgi:hypothetical protein
MKRNGIGGGFIDGGGLRVDFRRVGTLHAGH